MSWAGELLAWQTLAAAVGGYLLGSIPFGLVLTRLSGLGDIRDIGSGNIGATNVLRTGRKGLAAATLVLDGGKGAVAVVAFAWWGAAAGAPMTGLAAGLFTVLGHNFPPWLAFKGGKGVATTLGVLLAAAWPVGLLACLTWLATAAIFRYSSLAALVALSAAPVYMALLSDLPDTLLAALLAAFSVVRHHANIRRMIGGREPRIGSKK